MTEKLTRTFSMLAFAALLFAPAVHATEMIAPVDEATAQALEESDGLDADLAGDLSDVPLIQPYVYRVACQARNGRGEIFVARGRADRLNRVQDRAVQKCYDAGSRRCRPLGCHYTY